MAISAAKVSRNRVFCAKVETTTGSPIALTGTDGVFNCFDPVMSGEIPRGDRRGQGSLSRLSQVPGARKGKFTFKTELFGNGSSAAVPTWASTLLPSAGFSASGAVMTPLTGNASFPTLTLGHFVAGQCYQLAGAALGLTIKGKSGEPLMCEWTAEGVWQPPTDVALPTPTYPTVVPPRFAGATFTVGGTSFKISEFELSFNIKQYVRQDPTNVAGFIASCVVDRDPVIKIDPETLAVATQDWFGGHLAGTTYAFSLAIGSTVGNTMTIAAPVAQLMNAPGLKDRGGIQATALEFQCNRNSAAGDDEVSITWS